MKFLQKRKQTPNNDVNCSASAWQTSITALRSLEKIKRRRCRLLSHKVTRAQVNKQGTTKEPLSEISTRIVNNCDYIEVNHRLDEAVTFSNCFLRLFESCLKYDMRILRSFNKLLVKIKTNLLHIYLESLSWLLPALLLSNCHFSNWSKLGLKISQIN